VIAALASTLVATPSGRGDGAVAAITTVGQRAPATESIIGRDQLQEVADPTTTAPEEQAQPQEQSPPVGGPPEPGDASVRVILGSAPTPEPQMDEVNQYLWSVYQRSPVKQDGSGDFTWKDGAAAARREMSLADYVIVGMDRDFRELLYRAGLAMDAAGFRWTILSGFRDDYRQGLASGYKARTTNSLHGGSATTGGYGHGCAVDIKDADGNSRGLWVWLDAHGAELGLERPLAGLDPAHVQPRGPWHEMAAALRGYRLAKGPLLEEGVADARPADVSTILPSAADMLCIGLHHRHYEVVETSSTVDARIFKSPARAHGLHGPHGLKASIEREKLLSKAVGRLSSRSAEGSPARTSRSLARHAVHALPHRGGTT
jgi:hypothetical protein